MNRIKYEAIRNHVVTVHAKAQKRKVSSFRRSPSFFTFIYEIDSIKAINNLSPQRYQSDRLHRSQVKVTLHLK